jgi:N-acetylglutamate synthase-like GNAT family acetyltransferase
MKTAIALENVTIRTELKPGDIGYVIYMHGDIYSKEYGYSLGFECYVVESFVEFYKQYDSTLDRVWICEHNEKIVGFLALMHRNKAAQLRYFIMEKPYRGIGLGKKLMNLYMNELNSLGYESSYLLTVDELPAAASLYKRHGFRLIGEKPFSDFGKPLMEQKYELVLR